MGKTRKRHPGEEREGRAIYSGNFCLEKKKKTHLQRRNQNKLITEKEKLTAY